MLNCLWLPALATYLLWAIFSLLFLAALVTIRTVWLALNCCWVLRANCARVVNSPCAPVKYGDTCWNSGVPSIRAQNLFFSLTSSSLRFPFLYFFATCLAYDEFRIGRCVMIYTKVREDFLYWCIFRLSRTKKCKKHLPKICYIWRRSYPENEIFNWCKQLDVGDAHSRFSTVLLYTIQSMWQHEASLSSTFSSVQKRLIRQRKQHFQLTC